MLNHEDFKNDKKDAGEIGVGHQVTALYEIIPAGIETALMVEPEALKYQNIKRPHRTNSREWLHIQVRYKRPGENGSQLLEQVVSSALADQSLTSDHFRWSAAVASFGMLLRDSEFRGSTDMSMILNLANGARKNDPYGYRSEFVQLVSGVDNVAWLEASR